MLVIIVVLFFLLWTPRILWDLTVAIYERDHNKYFPFSIPVQNNIQNSLMMVSYVNSVVNAPVYFSTSK